MEMSVTTVEEGIRRIRLIGRLDSAGVDRVELKFNSAASQGAHLIVDLSGVSFLASMGVRMLVAAAKLATAEGHKIVLLSPQEAVEEFIKDAGLDSLLPLAQSEDEAKAQLETSDG